MASKAIQTAYNGYLFRSRLEAKWAVFFDMLRVRYEYEREGFDLGEVGYYLPDFWLPDFEVWIEIKGQMPTDEEEKRAAALADSSGHTVFIFWGEIPLPSDAENIGGPDLHDSAFAHFPKREGESEGGWDNHYNWCECPKCGKLGIEFDGRAARLGCGCHPSSDKTYNVGSPRLMAAYIAARSARFEHGEKPRKP